MNQAEVFQLIPFVFILVSVAGVTYRLSYYFSFIHLHKVKDKTESRFYGYF